MSEEMKLQKGNATLPPGFPASKEELKERLDEVKPSYTLPEIKRELPRPSRLPTEYFEVTKLGALRFVPAWLAKEIMYHYHFMTLQDTNEIYAYNNDLGIYKPNGESLIRIFTSISLGDLHRKHYAEEVVYQIRVSTYIPREEFKVPDGLLVLENGVFDIANNKLNPFTPKILALNRIPIKYNPSADCPKIKKFISDIVPPKDEKILQEATGYLLKRGYPYQKAFMMVGDGANGKTTFLNLLIRFIGADNVSSISLQELVSSRFAAAELYGKMANIYDDLSQNALKRTGQFKMATGGGRMKGERKFRNPFFFVNDAKMFFSANQIPEADDTTIAFFRRWTIINFPNKFVGDDADPDLLEKLTTEDELSGFLNWALEGLKRLNQQGDFSHSKTVDEIQEQYERMSSPIKAFRIDHLEIAPESLIPKDELYTLYVEYCIKNQLPAKAKNIFSMLLYRELPNIAETRIREKKKRVQCWKGVRFCETKIEEDPDRLDQDDQTSLAEEIEKLITISRKIKTETRNGRINISQLKNALKWNEEHIIRVVKTACRDKLMGSIGPQTWVIR